MKSINCFLLVVFPFFLIAQENESRLDSLTNYALDSIRKAEKKLYIRDHTGQLNIKFEVSNDIFSYEIPFQQETVDIRPNLGTRYALVFSYKFATIRIGIRPKKTSESVDNKGESDSFRIKIQLLFENWVHKFEFNQVEGYYITNTNDIIDGLTYNYIQLPNLETTLFAGSTSYKFNKNYSIRSVISQTEVQLKSVGSFLAGVQYFLYKIDGTGYYIDQFGEEQQRQEYSTSSGFDFILDAGYHYNFVYKKLYANIGAVVGAGLDFNKTTLHSYSAGSSIDKNTTNFIVSFQGAAGIGYNLEKIFFGATAEYKSIHQSRDKDLLQFNTYKNSFSVFIGYRFRAPKSIAKPIDNIEERLPMLKQD